ncbi:MAG: MMPL family transporter [Pirellulales bacterium]
MSEEATPQTRQPWIGRLLLAATRAALRYPVFTIALALAAAAAGMVLTGTRLGYRTSRLDLLNPKSDYNRLWIEYIKEFGDEDDAVVVVEGPSREHVVPVLQEISATLAREDRLFHAVLHEVDLGKVRAKGLYYLSPDELRGVEQSLDEVGPIVDGNWSVLSLGSMIGGLSARLRMEPQDPNASGASATEQKLGRLSGSLAAALGQKRRYQSPWPEMPPAFATLSELSAEYLLTKEGKLGFVLLRLARGKESFARGTEATDALRDLIAQASARHPETKIGLTGLPIMENDEMRSSQSSMLWAGVISLIGVALLFVAGFGGLRHALLANLVLLIGMAWAFGYVTLAVGHLNILSITFTSTLIGIGIDYGVYYVAAYLQRRSEVRSPQEALLRTTAAVGPGIVTGALTTAVAFLAAGLTNFTGVAELGLIAGGGVLLCAAAELLILPPVISLVDRSGFGQRVPEPLAIHAWIAPFVKAPRLTLVATILFTACVSLGLGSLWYDHNLLNMQAAGLESVELERKLLSECNQSAWYALSIADSREQLLARKAKFLKLKSVDRTEEIVSLLPTDYAVKQPIIRRIQQRLAALPERPPVLPVDRPENLGRALAMAQETMAELGGASSAWQFEQVRDSLRRMPVSDCYQLLSQFQQQMAGDLLSRLHVLKGMANPEPPQLSDLPESLVNRFVGHSGKHLLKIYGRGNIWDMDALKTFVKDVRTVDTKVTGNPLQAYEASLEMKRGYEHSAMYAAVVILAIVFFDFRNLRDLFLSVLPLVLGMLQTFGLMGLLNIPLNPANMIALPLILGIGVDYGIHIIHEFRDQPGRYRMSPGTAVAVVVDALTTIVGYGAMMIASHQGLQSLGRVLTIGITCCLFTSMIMLPALLTWITRNRPQPEAADEPRSHEASLPGHVIRRRDPAEHPGTGPHALPSPARSEWHVAPKV